MNPTQKFILYSLSLLGCLCIVLMLLHHQGIASGQSPSAFIILEDFESLDNGNVDLQGNWHANEPGAAAGALVDGYPPPIFQGKALRNDPNNIQTRGNAYLTLGDNQLADGSVTTFFVQVALEETTESNFSIGLSESESPELFSADGFNDYAVEVNFSAEGLKVLNDNTYESVTNMALESGLLLHLWFVIDNAQNEYRIYVDDKRHPEPRLVETNVGSSFQFRNGSAAALQSFMIRNSELNSGRSYIDNLALAFGGEVLVNPAPSFDLLEDFDALSGNLNGQNGWQASGLANVVDDPEGSGRSLALIGADTFAHKAMQLQQSGTGTIHFRMRRSGTVDGYGGASAQSAPSDWTDYEVQFGTQRERSNTFLVRDGDEFRELGNGYADEHWFCVWIVADTESKRYATYVQGEGYYGLTQLRSEDIDEFAFRNSTNSQLARFFAKTDPLSEGIIYIDDVHYDAFHANLTTPGTECAVSTPVVPNPQPTALPPLQPVDDPIPEPIQFDGTIVQFESIVTLPQTASGELSPRGNPRTRLNFLYHARDNSGRLFANDLRGQLYVIHPDEERWGEYLNIKPYFANWFEERGLNSGFSTFAFHPEYGTNGLLYTIHTELPNGTPDYATFAEPEEPVHGVLVEWKTEDPSADVFVGSQKRELLRVEQADVIHGMQLVQFNPLASPGDADYGLLYVSNGDGESSPRYSDASQNLGSLQGTIFRIDPAGNNSPNGKYGIPADNPFFSSSDSSILKEIYVYGFRNPHRFTWDPGSKKMILSSIGQNNIEEINLLVPGANYGWNEREGTFVFDRGNPETVKTLPENDSDFNYTYPVAQYDHDEGFAIIGGFAYRGNLMPNMHGRYLFGDIVQGHLFTVNVDELELGSLATIHKFRLRDEAGNEVEFKPLVDPENQRADLRFGLDEAGEIYLFSKQDGVIRRLAAAEVPEGLTATATATEIPTIQSTFTPTPQPTVLGTATPTPEPIVSTPIPTPMVTPSTIATQGTATVTPTLTEQPIMPSPVASESPEQTQAPPQVETTPSETPGSETPGSETPGSETPAPTPNAAEPPAGSSQSIKIHFPIVP